MVFHSTLPCDGLRRHLAVQWTKAAQDYDPPSQLDEFSDDNDVA